MKSGQTCTHNRPLAQRLFHAGQERSVIPTNDFRFSRTSAGHRYCPCPLVWWLEGHRRFACCFDSGDLQLHGTRIIPSEPNRRLHRVHQDVHQCVLARDCAEVNLPFEFDFRRCWQRERYGAKLWRAENCQFDSEPRWGCRPAQTNCPSVDIFLQL